MEQNEQSLKQGILDLKERLANNNNGDDEIRNNPTELLTKITKLEAMNRELNDRLESDQVVQSKGGLESPEDVFRQRISELERLEKHLKTQVSLSLCNGGCDVEKNFSINFLCLIIKIWSFCLRKYTRF